MERRDVADPAADREVARALRARGGSGTVADVEVATTLPQATVHRSLDRLLDGYQGAVGVAPGGALIYRFALGPLGLKARRERHVLWRAAIRASASVAAAAVGIFRTVFRAVLATQMLVYLMIVLAPVSVAVGVVVGIGIFLIGLIAAISSGDASGLFDILANPYALAIIVGGCVIYGIYLVFKKKMDLIMALAGRDERGQRGLAGFIAQVNDFALGPDRPPSRAERIDRAWTIRQDDERIVLERVRAGGGRLRAGDLVAWLGLGFEQADREAARICVEHNGEPAAADIDVVEFELRDLMTTTDASQTPSGGNTRHEGGVTLPQLTANSGKEDTMIVLLALANGGAGAVGWTLLHDRGPGWWHAAWIAGGVIPVAFTAVLLALCLLRVPGFLVRRTLRRRARRRAEVHDAIVAHCRTAKDAALDLGTLGSREETRPVAVALGGTFDLADDATRTVWRWPRLARELARAAPAEGLREVKELAD